MPPRYKMRSVNCGRRLVKLDRSAGCNDWIGLRLALGLAFELTLEFE